MSLAPSFKRAALAILTSLTISLPTTLVRAEESVSTEGQGTPLSHFISDGGYIFSTPFRRNNWAMTAGALGGVLAVSTFDRPVQKHFYRNRKEETPGEFRKTGDLLQFAGLAWGTGLGIHGALFDNAEHRRTGVLAYETYVWSAAVLGSIKALAGRKRPAESSNPYRFLPKEGGSSFPSGHTTQAFAAATLISEQYDSWWVTVPAYAGASSVGISRALANKHWMSDVVAGAALGTMIAHVLRKRVESRSPYAAWRIEADDQGVRLVHKF